MLSHNPDRKAPTPEIFTRTHVRVGDLLKNIDTFAVGTTVTVLGKIQFYYRQLAREIGQEPVPFVGYRKMPGIRRQFFLLVDPVDLSAYQIFQTVSHANNSGSWEKWDGKYVVLTVTIGSIGTTAINILNTINSNRDKEYRKTNHTIFESLRLATQDEINFTTTLK